MSARCVFAATLAGCYTPAIPTNIADPAISPDERVIVFAGEQNGKLDDLFYATRASVDVGFDPPIPVPTVSSTAADNDTEISSDGCTLYFASNRDMVRNVYVARVKR